MNKQTEAPWPPEDEILQHYGYAPADVHRNGVGVGYWKREEALARFAEQPEELKYLSDKKKIRIVFEYDPDFPVALHICYATLKRNEGFEPRPLTHGRRVLLKQLRRRPLHRLR